MKEFSQKKIVIVGATGNLGSAYVRSLANQGSQLFLLARQEAPLKKLQEQFPQVIGTAVLDDISKQISVEKAAKTVSEWSQEIDILINATGYDVRKPLARHTETEIKRTLDINLLGAILLTQNFLPLMKQQKGSTLVHSGGFADGRLAFPYYTVDVASRAGLFSFIEATNRELKQEGSPIRLTYFCPNAADTPSEKPYHRVWKEMNISISTVDEVCQALLTGLQKQKQVILMGKGTTFFAKLNSIFPRLSDKLLLNHYSKILQKYFGG